MMTQINEDYTIYTNELNIRNKNCNKSFNKSRNFKQNVAYKKMFIAYVFINFNIFSKES